jgi:hypothetical protein
MPQQPLGASSDHYEFLPGIGRQRTQGFRSPVIENQGNRLAKVRQTFLARLALPIGAWHFSTVRDIPWAVLLDDRREFVAHFLILPPGVLEPNLGNAAVLSADNPDTPFTRRRTEQTFLNRANLFESQHIVSAESITYVCASAAA